MADVEALGEAIKGMFPSATFPRFLRVPDGSVPPWTAVSISLPRPNTRAMSKRVLTYRIVVRVRVVGANDTAVWQIAPLVTAALEGQRVTCDGWDCSPLEQLNSDPMPYEDTDVTLTGTNTHPVVLPLDFDFYATTKETP